MKKITLFSLAEKEQIKLWWEYLKRSKLYIFYLKSEEEWGTGTLNEAIFDELFHLFGDVHKTEFETWWEKWSKFTKEDCESFLAQPLPDLISLLKKKGYTSFRNYLNKFSQISKFRFRFYVRNREGQHIKLADIDQLFPDCLHTIYKQSKIERGRDPSEKEIIEDFKHIFPMPTLVEVANLQDDTEEIVKDFRKFLTKYKKDPKINALHDRFKLIESRPLGQVRCRVLRQYLKIYDAREKWPKLAWEKLANKMYDEDPKFPIDESSYRRGYIRAKRIIENVENGQFPGDYGEDEK
jgi:hypothetical protein